MRRYKVQGGPPVTTLAGFSGALDTSSWLGKYAGSSKHDSVAVALGLHGAYSDWDKAPRLGLIYAFLSKNPKFLQHLHHGR